MEKKYKKKEKQKENLNIDTSKIEMKDKKIIKKNNKKSEKKL